MHDTMTSFVGFGKLVPENGLINSVSVAKGAYGAALKFQASRANDITKLTSSM